MRRALTTILETLARLIPLGLYPRILHRDVIDFFYHAVSDAPMPHVRHLYPVIPSADFEAALVYLKENYTFIDYQQLHTHVFYGEPVPKNAVHLSFDDGYAECFSVVRPLLQKYTIPCTFFITTNLIDNPILFYRNKQSLCVEKVNAESFEKTKFENLIASLPASLSTLPEFVSWLKDLRLPDEALIDTICERLGVDWRNFLVENQPYLTRPQIQQMQSEGFAIGAHTITHRKLMGLSSDEIETEIADSCKIIAEVTGQEIVPFSFPHSAFGLDRNLLAKIRARHPQIGLLFDTKGVRKDVSFIHNRVWAERFSSPISGVGNGEGGGLRAILQRAYQEAWVDEVLGLRRRLRAG